jgi:hypothetical protein
MNYTAWTDAETRVFSRLCQKLGVAEGVKAFRGFLPPIPGALALMTGGSDTAGDQDRLAGNGRAYGCCNLSGQIASCHAKLDDAQQWAMKVMDLFADNSNFSAIGGNVVFFHATGMPGRPEATEVQDGIMLWVISIPVQIVFTTT